MTTLRPTTAATFATDVATAPGRVIIDFWAPWCGPCRAVTPVLEALAAANPEVTFLKVNIDEEPALAERYRVMSVPTVIAFDGGEVTKTVTGAKSKTALVRDLNLA